MEKEMKFNDVIDLYAKLESLGIVIWIDGGWAVDFLLGKITRNHSDLDVAVEYKNLEKFKEYLQTQGYRELKREKDKKWDFVLGDDAGHEIDVHSFSFDGNGDVVEENDWDGYSKKSLAGSGIINGRAVRCVSLEQLIKTHNESRRRLKEKDYEDMDALHKKFYAGIDN
jgi:lincosamide nucleotidyltransferase A/C/D/E